MALPSVQAEGVAADGPRLGGAVHAAPLVAEKDLRGELRASLNPT
jgi:hypothetical protein